MSATGLILFIGFGLLVILVAWLPVFLRGRPVSLAMIFVALGAAAGLFIPGWPRWRDHPVFVEHFTEIVVIIALMGAGLKIDRKLSWRGWIATWRLLAIAMPLSIGAIAGLAVAALGLPVPVAILLGALMAPTDPVLASDIQVGPPRSGEEDEVRFALTSEAGLNDGLAFPFVNLAIAMAAAGLVAGGWPGPALLMEWLAVDVAWKMAAGIGVGWAVGWLAGWATFHLPEGARLSRTGDGFLALGLTFASYGLAEWAHGYGFLAVFVTALSFRAAERQDKFHEELHDFAEQVERILMMILLVLFGGALTTGLMAPLSLADAAFGLAVLLVVRPLAGAVSLAGGPWPTGEKALIAFFGIRGVGSFYYLQHALNERDFGQADRLWAITAFIVLASILIHGATASPLLARMDRRRDADGTARDLPD